MKKSNKTSFLYILSSVSLLIALVFGGCYGIYMSVGLSFVRQGVANMTNGGATNVSFGGNVNFQTSMIGVIILSVALIVIAIIDFISLIKQIVFFKQFGVIKDSNIVKNIEKKTKGKGKIVFFAILIDIISFIAGILGIFINMRTFASGNMIWIIYVVDGLISVLSVLSIVLLIVKLKKLKNDKKDISSSKKNDTKSNKKYNQNENNELEQDNYKKYDFNLNDIEYKLLKLKQLKNARILTKEEYDGLRKKVIDRENIFFEQDENENKKSNLD